MKLQYIALFGAIAAFSSCSTAYRSAQTPDDVYYSPAPVQSGYVSADKSEQGRDSYYYQDEEESQIRQGIQDPTYRTPVSISLGYGYGYNPYGYNSLYNPYYGGYNPLAYMNFYNPYMPLAYSGFGYGLGSFYSPYNSLYSPYYNPYYGAYYGHSYYPGNTNTNGGSISSGPRRYNLNPYIHGNTGSSVLRGNTEVSPTTSEGIRRTTGVGNAIRRVTAPNRERNTYVTPDATRARNNNSQNNNTYNRPPERTFNNTPQVNSSPAVRTPSPSPSSSGGSAPVRSFGR